MLFESSCNAASYSGFGEVEGGRELRDVDAAQVVGHAELVLENAHLVLREGNSRVAAQFPLAHCVFALRTCSKDKQSLIQKSISIYNIKLAIF